MRAPLWRVGVTEGWCVGTLLVETRSPTVGVVLGGTRTSAVVLVAATVMSIAGCSSSTSNSPSARYAEDCDVVLAEFTSKTMTLTEAVANLEPIGPRRIQSPVIETPEGDKIRKLRPLSRGEKSEWEQQATQLLFQRLAIAFAQSWPLAQDEDLRRLLRDLADGDRFETNFASLSVMCPGIDQELESVTSEYSAIIDARSQALEEPANL